MKKNILIALGLLLLFLIGILFWLGAFSPAKVEERPMPQLQFAGYAVEGLGDTVYTQATFQRIDLLKKLKAFDIDSTRSHVNMHFQFKDERDSSPVKLIAGYKVTDEEAKAITAAKAAPIITLPATDAIVSEKRNKGMISLLFALRKMHEAVQTRKAEKGISDSIPAINIIETNRGKRFTYYVPVGLEPSLFETLWQQASTSAPEAKAKTIQEVQAEEKSEEVEEADSVTKASKDTH